ncbi:MAG TPA: hypothetical protein VJ894_01265 [Cryomorphaceae bacterium]|nr:hypothetical protein [Cryomorphaceae bacterium]
MGAIVIKVDKKSQKILKDLADYMGAKIHTLSDDEYEDFLLGTIIRDEKTKKDVDRDSILKELDEN